MPTSDLIATCGSMAYDSIMVFEGHFKDHILPDQTHILNLSFLVPVLRREYGGCAGNIAYNLNLLGGEPLPVATVGDDIGPYMERFRELGIDTRGLMRLTGTYTAQAFITTDLSDNQLSAFHPGAMARSQENRVLENGLPSLAIVAPDSKEGMLQHVSDLASAGVPFIFDPGQALPLFSGPDLMQCIEQATYVTVNDYEGRMVEEKTGCSQRQLAEMVEAWVMTKGGEGSEIYTKNKTLNIACAKPTAIVDPTGCGDAYRGGLLYGLSRGFDWETTGRLASLMGAIKIASQGGQNHQCSQLEIAERFKQEFGYAF